MTRTRELMTGQRRSLFQASAVARFLVAGLLATILWGAILWAWQ